MILAILIGIAASELCLFREGILAHLAQYCEDSTEGGPATSMKHNHLDTHQAGSGTLLVQVGIEMIRWSVGTALQKLIDLR